MGRSDRFSNQRMDGGMSLLDLLAVQMGCVYLSDLRYLDREQRIYLAESLRPLQARQSDLRDWNDALAYLTGAQPCATAEEAQATLIAGLLAR